jgi:hypothetical protein
MKPRNRARTSKHQGRIVSVFVLAVRSWSGKTRARSLPLMVPYANEFEPHRFDNRLRPGAAGEPRGDINQLCARTEQRSGIPLRSVNNE